jgi:tripartite ATP-independent transporter DctM subunit
MWLTGASQRMHRVLDPVVTWVCNFGMYALVVMVLTVVADVLMRALKIGIPGLNELEVFMLIAVTFLSIAYVGIKKGHLSIELFTSRLSQRHQAIVKTINDFFGLFIMVIITWQSAVYALHKLPVSTQVLNLPLTPAIFLITLGSGLLSLVLIADIFEDLGGVVASYRNSAAVKKILVGLVIVAVPLVVLTIPLWLEWLPWEIAPLTAGYLGIALMLLMMFSGLVIAYAMAVVGFLGVQFLSSWPTALSVSGLMPYHYTANHWNIALPLFVLMGCLCATPRGVGTRLFQAVDKWIGQVPGGLAMATVGASAAFGAVCGETLATIATIGRVALPQMKKYKYDGALRSGCVAAGGTLGILIPPSIVFIIYAVIAEESIGKLFIAGIIPGALAATLMMVVIYVQAKRNPALAAGHAPSTFKEKLGSLTGTFEMLILFLLVIGGIYGGLFSPIEGGAIGAAGALIIGLARGFIRSRQEIGDALLEGAKITGMLLIIFVGVGIFGSFLGQSHLPAELGNLVANLGVSRWLIFLGIAFMYMVLGCVMNIIPAIMLSLPVIMPTVVALGFDPVWFGVVVVLLVMMGQITPPVGVACFVTRSIDPEVPLSTIFKGVLPLFACLMLVVVLLAFFPQIALFLPNLMRGG